MIDSKDGGDNGEGSKTSPEVPRLRLMSPPLPDDNDRKRQRRSSHAVIDRAVLLIEQARQVGGVTIDRSAELAVRRLFTDFSAVSYESGRRSAQTDNAKLRRELAEMKEQLDGQDLFCQELLQIARDVQRRKLTLSLLIDMINKGVPR